jgi:hypothetical protein
MLEAQFLFDGGVANGDVWIFFAQTTRRSCLLDKTMRLM